jgi:Flp pilus assembly protein TadG
MIPWGALRARRGDPREQRGQVLVLVVFGMVAIMAGAGLAFDIGRFYSERRFLQNAADAGVLAIANALIRGETNTAAEAEGRDIITRNLLGSPTGSVGSVATTPIYETGHAGEASYLQSGILINGGEIRVAIQSPVTYTFGRVIGLGSNTVGVQAMAKTVGDMLPIAVRHYINAPGPYAGATSPCDGNENQFQDLVATANTACLGSSTDASLRSTPSAGSACNPSNPGDDPVNHGPVIALVGQGANPSNAADFRGFVALDIRNFESSTPPSNVFYNGVTAGTNANTLKSMEAGWVATGYPGPAFPVVTTPPDPNDQVGIMSGNSSGIIVDAINDRYAVCDTIFAAVYSGTVSSIPDFTFTVPSTATINTNQNRNGSITMSVTKNSAFTGVVTTSAFKDWGDTGHPWGTTLNPLTFSPSPLTPNGTVTWSTFTTTGAPQGVYTVWVQGHSDSPVLLDHYYPVAISIGSVNRDFSTTSSGTIALASTGATGTTTVNVNTPNNNGTYFNGTVNLSVEGGADANGVLPAGIGAVSVSPSSFVLNKGTSQNVTVSVNGGTLGPGVYSLTVRVTGTNGNGQPVTRLIPITLTIATASTSNEYVDILGFTVFRVASIDSNAVYGYAISGVYSDMNDPALRRGQVARLVPWS